MKGLLADVNNVKQVRVLLMLLQEESRGEFWLHLGLTTPTFADANRVLSERSYAELVADRLLEYLYDMDNLRGAGRLYLP